MLCDFAEYYHIYDYKALPVDTQAALLFGLSPNSRTKRAIVGMKYDQETLLLAAILDDLRLILWQRSKKGAKKPESILKAMTEPEKKEKKEIMTFATPEDFEKARRELNG